MVSLDNIKLGSKVTVKNISKNTSIRKKLMDMGIVPGVKITVSGKAPLGDPIEIIVKNYRLTLRKNEAANIFVE